VGGIFVTIHGRFGSGFNAEILSATIGEAQKNMFTLQDICRD
jgi:hypothetical protein